MTEIISFIFILFIITLPTTTIMLLVIFLIKQNKNKQKTNYQQRKETYNYNNTEYYPYQKKYLLTKNEWYFYKKLKPIIDNYNLQIIAKIRLADIVEVKQNNKGQWQALFNKIKSKHIDFAIVKKDNFEIKYLIELDDTSHNRIDRIERDEFVNELCFKTGYKLIRTYGDIAEIDNTLKSDIKENSLS